VPEGTRVNPDPNSDGRGVLTIDNAGGDDAVEGIQGENRLTRGQLHFEFGKNLRFEETELSDRVEFSEDSITLYPVQRGTVKRLEISGEAFDAK
jgi:hypothetical protein